MSDQGHNAPIFSVSEISQALKRTVEDSFSHVRVRGEISGFKRAASGHMYMALKDDGAVMDGVCWKGVASRLGLNPEDGMEVIIQGRLTTYPGRSKYQIVIESMELAGEGALLKLLEDRKKKLAAEGLFDPARKKPIPFLPKVIGVVTSPTGAVFRDIMHRLNDRFPRHVLLWPVLVQGENAAEQVASAIYGFNAIAPGGSVPRPDLLIVARGGGSLEDLWGFNEEVVVRAAADSDIPLISAVGHETDTTLIDYASDQRAPTPTAAAEMAVPVRLDLLAQVMDDGSRLVSSMGRMIVDRENRLEGLGRGLPDLGRLVEEMEQRLDDRVERLGNARATYFDRKENQINQLTAKLIHPKQQVQNASDRFTALTRAFSMAGKNIITAKTNAYEKTRAGERLSSGMGHSLEKTENKLSNLGSLLESYSHKSALSRGYTVIRDQNNLPVTKAKGLKTGDGLEIEFADGRTPVVVSSSGRTPPSPKPKPKKKPSPDIRQGELL
ncbi:MAG: exodeoxyribonuclease VII large subunit [Rhodospirillales bacterium]|nr:exodeoxyribonuclease VII large subunit [Rhodospirillales bacterium]